MLKQAGFNSISDFYQKAFSLYLLNVESMHKAKAAETD